MKGGIIAAVLLLLAVSGIFAQEAVITEFTGTVEIKHAHSVSWESASRGQTIAGDTMISTGFKSTALISIGNSVLTLRPLTRLTLSEISSHEGIETININLQAGRLRADVKPLTGTRTAVTVQSPAATASVRGTVFEVDVFSLKVIEGSVDFRGNSGIHTVVDSGGYSFIEERTGRAALAIETRLSSLSPDQPIAFDSFQPFQGAAPQQSNEIDIVGEIEFD